MGSLFTHSLTGTGIRLCVYATHSLAVCGVHKFFVVVVVVVVFHTAALVRMCIRSHTNISCVCCSLSCCAFSGIRVQKELSVKTGKSFDQFTVVIILRATEIEQFLNIQVATKSAHRIQSLLHGLEFLCVHILYNLAIFIFFLTDETWESES